MSVFSSRFQCLSASTAVRGLVWGCLVFVALSVLLVGGVSADGATVSSSSPVADQDAGSSADTNTTAVLIDLTAYDRVDEYADREQLIDGLKSHAETHQQPLITTVNNTAGIQLVDQFWVTNAVRVTVDTTRVDVSRLTEIEHVEAVHMNLTIETADTDVAAGTSSQLGPADSIQPSSMQPTVAETEVQSAVWGIERIGVPVVWDEYGNRGEGSRIAVLDTGVDAEHPDLELAPGGWAEFDSDGERLFSTPYDANGHGSHVSGTVAGGDASGTSIGAAPDSELFHGKIFDDSGSGSGTQLLAGMEWAIEQNADVLVLSLGFQNPEFVDSFIEPVRNAEAAGTMVIASAGNGGSDTSASPGNIYDATAVGATDPTDDVATFSGGKEITTAEAWAYPPADWPATYIVPDLTAPGVAITSAVPGGGYADQSGTSMAAPHVGGAVALIQSNTDETLSAATIRELLASTAVRPSDADPTRYGEGRIATAAALDQYYEEQNEITAVLNAPANITAGEEVTLDASDSTATRGLDRYEWTFADGTTETTSEPTITRTLTVSEPGNVTVSVTVVDTADATDTATTTIDVRPSTLESASLSGQVTNETQIPLPASVVVTRSFTDTAGNDYRIEASESLDNVTTDVVLNTTFEITAPMATANVTGQQLYDGYDFDEFPLVSTEVSNGLTLLTFPADEQTAQYHLQRIPAQQSTDTAEGVDYGVIQAQQLQTEKYGNTTLDDVQPATNRRANITIAGAEPTTPVMHESGVSQALFDAVDEDDTGELTRSEVRALVQGFVRDRAINGVAVTRSDVRILIQYFITQ